MKSVFRHLPSVFCLLVSGFSAAAGQKNGRSNRKRNSEKANIEPRLGVDEYRMSK